MFAQTHKIVALNTLNNVNCSRALNKKQFIWGNIKPDIVPSLLVKKHYQNETFEFVIDKIMELCSLPAIFLNEKKKIKYLSEQIGVICHFLTDFFCLPHSKRWEFKHMMIPHIKYEMRLHEEAEKFSCNFDYNYFTDIQANRETIISVIGELHESFTQEESYENDLYFSTQICSIITTIIVNNISINKIYSI